MKSIFTDQRHEPTEHDLQQALGNTFKYWEIIRLYVNQLQPAGVESWNFSGEKYGWSFRVSDKKRALIYLLPRDGFFKAAFVFGQKAYDEIMAGDINAAIKEELKAARRYAEGRGIRIEVRNAKLIKDIRQLIQVKIAH